MGVCRFLRLTICENSTTFPARFGIDRANEARYYTAYNGITELHRRADLQLVDCRQ